MVLGTHVFIPACTLINHIKIHIYFKIHFGNETSSSKFYQSVTDKKSFMQK